MLMTSCVKKPRNHRTSYLALLCRVCFSFSPLTPTLLFMHYCGMYAIMVDCFFFSVSHWPTLQLLVMKLWPSMVLVACGNWAMGTELLNRVSLRFTRFKLNANIRKLIQSKPHNIACIGHSIRHTMFNIFN